MKAYERLLRYARIHTSSDEKTDTTPSSARQRDLSLLLEKEMADLGFLDTFADEHAYVYGFLPATAGREEEPCIALIAHLDTIPDSDFPGKNVRPQLVPDYDGGDLLLGESGRVLSPALFPDLKDLKGHTLIVTDGMTILGADDKAGIAEILTACEELLREKLPHGKIAVCFTPDEEIGHGAALLSLERLGADFGYTVDGGGLDQINTETFHAAEAVVSFAGVNVHPGDAKGRMRNASLLAMEFAALLPAAERPETTEDHEGFFHLTDMSGSVDRASLNYIIRDHDAAHFAIRKTMMRKAADFLNEKYGEGVVTLTVRDQYRNMAEVLEGCPEAAARAEAAIRRAGLTPRRVPVRGGTDGSQLSYRGLPCPNLGTGGACFHGPYEHISVENMDLAVRILKNLLTFADNP
ncbi:MAG: peptidase T [Oscillospiraceae bacterium]|nr:peptidase T [Oscillospiraceae bacterium]